MRGRTARCRLGGRGVSIRCLDDLRSVHMGGMCVLTIVLLRLERTYLYDRLGGNRPSLCCANIAGRGSVSIRKGKAPVSHFWEGQSLAYFPHRYYSHLIYTPFACNMGKSKRKYRRAIAITICLLHFSPRKNNGRKPGNVKRRKGNKGRREGRR